MDLVVDMILISQAKKDLENGSELLRSLSNFGQMSGSVTGYLVGGYINTNFHLKWTFLIYSSFGLFVLVLGLNLRKSIDQEGIDELQGFWVELVKTFKDIVTLSRMRIIQYVVLFLLLDGFLAPSFSEFHLYYQTDWRNISKMNMGYMDVITNLGMLLGVVLYSMVLRKVEIRNLLRLYFLSNLVKNGLYLSFIQGHHLKIGLSDNLFLFVHGFIFDGVLNLALYALPVGVLMVKLAPKGMEGTALAALMSLRNLEAGAEGPLVGSFINTHFVGVTKEDMSGYSLLTLIPMAMSIPFVLLVVFLIPTNN